MDKKIVLRAKLSEIIPYLDDREIILVLGARRTGKTTLLSQIKDFLLKEKRTDKNNIYFFNLDVVDDLITVKEQPSFIRYLKSRINKERLYVFIDEAQRLESPGLFLKGIYDLNLPIKFIASGSSSLEIKAKTQEALTGRKRLFYLYPFSFEEFLLLKDEKLFEIKNKGDLSDPDKRTLKELLAEFMVWGGYPEVCLEENQVKKIKAMEEIFNSYLDKDIVNFLKIEDKIAFAKMVKILASQIGGLVNVNETSLTLGIKNETAKRYLAALESTFVVKLLPPFFKNTRKEISRMPKLYFIDNGLRNFALKRFGEFREREDKGALLENYTFSFLIKHLETFEGLFFWRTKDKAEIDFIIEKESPLPLEVKGRLKKPIFPRPLLSFAKDYKIKEAVVVNLSFEGEALKNGLKIQYILPENLGNLLQEVK